MPPLFIPTRTVGKHPPLVLPRALHEMVDFGDGGWPVTLVIPNDAGLLDPSCGYWHGATAANDAGSSR